VHAREGDDSKRGRPATRRSLSDLRDVFAGQELPDAPPDAAGPELAPMARRPITARLVVRHERAGRGGKTVTIAEGPALHGRKLEELARDAGKALGVGARIEASALVLQGDQTERLIAWLASRGFASIVRGS
jgi:translation initiation factor 1